MCQVPVFSRQRQVFFPFTLPELFRVMIFAYLRANLEDMVIDHFSLNCFIKRRKKILTNQTQPNNKILRSELEQILNLPTSSSTVYLKHHYLYSTGSFPISLMEHGNSPADFTRFWLEAWYGEVDWVCAWAQQSSAWQEAAWTSGSAVWWPLHSHHGKLIYQGLNSSLWLGSAPFVIFSHFPPWKYCGYWM